MFVKDKREKTEIFIVVLKSSLEIFTIGFYTDKLNIHKLKKIL